MKTSAYWILIARIEKLLSGQYDWATVEQGVLHSLHQYRIEIEKEV